MTEIDPTIIEAAINARESSFEQTGRLKVLADGLTPDISGKTSFIEPICKDRNSRTPSSYGQEKKELFFLILKSQSTPVQVL